MDELFALALERLAEDTERAGRLLRAVLRRMPDHPEAGFYLDLASSGGAGGKASRGKEEGRPGTPGKGPRGTAGT